MTHSKLFLTTFAGLFCLGVSISSHAEEFEDYARVLNVTPQVERVNVPEQRCHTEYVSEASRGRGVGGSIIGGITGGLLGSQVGRGNGRVAASAVGAITGAVVGDRIENNRQEEHERPVQRCRSVEHWESHTTGYNVNYEYQGRKYNTVMPYDPGRRMRVAVDVRPLD